MNSLQFVIITHSENSTQKTLIFKKISVFICRKLAFLCLLFWNADLIGVLHILALNIADTPQFFQGQIAVGKPGSRIETEFFIQTYNYILLILYLLFFNMR